MNLITLHKSVLLFYCLRYSSYIKKERRIMSNNLIDTFFKMVQISSESGEEEEFISYLENIFTKELKGKCIIDNYGNLIVKVPAKNTICKRPVFFGFHADTVKP